MDVRFLTGQDKIELKRLITELNEKLIEIEEKQNQIPEINEDDVIGGYYIPVVDADGNLSWVPSKEGMPDVDSANIRGPKGERGLAGVSATHKWSGTSLTISSASGSSSRDLQGAAGKSAYEYAKEGGFTGTEKEFATKLAALLR